MQSTFRLVAAAVLLLFGQTIHAQCVSLTGSNYSQDFDTLSNTAGSTTNSLAITGWFLTESGGGARDNEKHAVDTGGSNTGDTYSYGAAGATDRALGSLRSGTLIPVIGACFTNNTGGTLSNPKAAYTGEQWRLGTAARTDQFSFQVSTNATDLVTGTWTGISALNFVTPDTATTGAKNGNAATDRTVFAATDLGISVANGATFWIRWSDTDASGADDGLAIDDFSLDIGGGSGTPNLSVNDVTVVEGDSGTTNAVFTVSLSAPAPAGGVSFDIGTADGTATILGSDYASASGTGQTIAEGNSSYSFSVPVYGDTSVESNETFFVNITNVAGANLTDAQGQGTITNDDYAITPIHDIQGSGNTSPLAVGSIVATEGIVTARVSNGFFLQASDAEADADPATSEAIFVFTSSAPSASAAVGARVRVSATLDEFQRSGQLPITELKAVTALIQLSTGNALPTAVELTAADANAGSDVNQLERYEHMRVSVASLTVVAPVDGNINEAQATSTSDGIFYGVLPTVARPFREPGVSALDATPFPVGVTPPVFDTNPERIRVRSTGQTGAPNLAVDVGDVVNNLVGVLDYGFGAYTLTPDPSPAATITLGSVASPVPAAAKDEITVGGFNLLHFFDDVNDHDGAATLTTAAYQKRLQKTGNAICAYTRNPDILGVVEVEHIKALSELATSINGNGGNALFPGSCSENPGYAAYLFEGNDIGGIDVGFLVKTAEVAPGKPRVEVIDVVQYGKDALFTNADGSTELLNDRPSLVLRARVNQANGASQTLTVIANHLRSLIGVNSTSAGSKGWPTVGARVRAKRAAQAQFLAQLIQDRQAADPSERIVLLGDFNAYEFSDGFVDTMGIITGREAAADAVLDYVDSPIETPLTNTADLAPAEQRYSFSFDGNAQSLDHMVVNQAVLDSFLDVRAEHARINADFGVDNYGDFSVPVRVSDHDPVVLFLREASFATADLSTAVIAGASPISPGSLANFVIDVANAGPDDATGVKLDLSAAVAPNRVSVTPAAGWTCGAPVTDGGTGMLVHCSLATLAVAGNGSFQVAITTGKLDAGFAITLGAAVSGSSTDDFAGNNSSSATVDVIGQTDLALALQAPLGAVNASLPVTFKATVSNVGSYGAYKPYVDFTVDAPPAVVRSVRSPLGRFTCGQLSSTASSSTWRCRDTGSFAPGRRDTINIDVQSVRGWTAMSLTVTGVAASLTPDAKPADNTAAATAPVR